MAIREVHRKILYCTMFVACAYPQGASHIPPIPRGLITHGSDHMVLVEAREARPLRQATVSLASEYGWIIDYEDPVYDRVTDLVDDTDPTWRAAHPLDPGGERPSGEQFIASAPEPTIAELENGQAQRSVFEKIISEYNSSKNPGRFVLVDVGNRRFAVVGRWPQNPAGLFGRQIHIASGNTLTSANESLSAVLKEISKQVGKPVDIGDMAPLNLLVRAKVNLGSTDIVARSALAKILDSMPANLVYQALYVADIDGYLVSILPAMKVSRDSTGVIVEKYLRSR